jgi:hypothetical protein
LVTSSPRSTKCFTKKAPFCSISLLLPGTSWLDHVGLNCQPFSIGFSYKRGYCNIKSANVLTAALSTYVMYLSC